MIEKLTIKKDQVQIWTFQQVDNSSIITNFKKKITKNN